MEQFALQMKRFEGDGWREDGTPIQPLGSEARIYGKMWALQFKGDEDALPSIIEVINGLKTWVCDTIDMNHRGLNKNKKNETKQIVL